MIRQILILLLLVSGTSGAAVYKWVDADGVTHFGDEPRRGAVKVKLGESTTYAPPVYTTQQDEEEETGEAAAEDAEAASEENSEEGSAAPSKQAEPVVYELIMKAPVANETVRPLDGRISFSFAIEPSVPESYRLKLSLDGRNVNQPINGLNFSIANIPLGLHQAQGWLFDQNGKLLAKSDLITFTLRRAPALPAQ